MTPRDPAVPRYLTLDEAAVMAHLPKLDLMTLISNGTGPDVVRLSSRERILFREDLLDGWLARRAGGL
jgi:hypothetical protein